MALIEFDPPARFVAGTVGAPGQRQFFLQVRGGEGDGAGDEGRVLSVAIEKPQVQVLAERVGVLLDEVAPDTQAPEAAADNDPLTMPVDAEFTVGTMGLSWNEARRRLVVECHAAGDSYDSADVLEQVEAGAPEIAPEDDPTQLVLRVVLTAEAAREFVRRSERLVAAGRPPCPFCGMPLEPSGHLCPRANGYRR